MQQFQVCLKSWCSNLFFVVDKLNVQTFLCLVVADSIQWDLDGYLKLAKEQAKVAVSVTTSHDSELS